MRQPLYYEVGQSPIAEAFSKIATAYGSGGSAEERAYRAALAQKTQMEAEQTANQRQAMQGAPSVLASLFTRYTPEGQPVDQMQGPLQPGTDWQTEDPAARSARITSSLADLYMRIGKDNAAALQNGLQAGQAFGSPDDMRRSMVLGGSNVGPDFSPTGAESDRISSRNANLRIQEERAKPLSESQFKAQQLAQNFDSLDKLNEYQRQALGANPPGSSTIETRPDGTMVMTRGGSSAANQKAASAQQAKSDIDYLGNETLALIDQMEKSGALASTSSDIGSRAINAAQTAGVPGNQALQRVLAPEQQKQRDALQGQKALFLTMYRSAANIPATVGDSALEAGTLANALPDPAVSPEANRERVKTFMNIYGAAKANRQQGMMTPTNAAPNTGNDPIAAARAAIAAGKSREHVLQRLRQNGIEPPPDL